MTDTLNKTLIIRFSSVGDIVLSSLLVRAFRSRFPNSQLDFAVKEEFADVVRFNPHLSNVITLPRQSSFDDLRKLRSHIHSTNYDLIIDIHDSLRSRYLSLGARRVVRINKRKLARFFLVKFKKNLYDKFGGAPSVALRYLEPVREFGVEDDDMGLEIFFPNEVRARVEETVRGLVYDLVEGFEIRQQFIGVCPSAKHNTKMWLKERFAEAASTLSKTHNQPIVLFGSGDDEVQRCKEIERLIRDLNAEPTTLNPKPQTQNLEPRTLNLAGKISLTETAAMMDYCSIVVTNDTGLMHIAAARKRNVVAIFGPTVKELGFFPFGTRSTVVENKNLDCRPCTHIGLAQCPKGHFKCMNDISTRHVIDSVSALLQ